MSFIVSSRLCHVILFGIWLHDNTAIAEVACGQFPRLLHMPTVHTISTLKTLEICVVVRFLRGLTLPCSHRLR